MSLTMRLTLGLGPMVVGTCLALPFFRTTAPEASSVADAASNQMSLGQGVSLQMPGQTMSTPLAAKPPEPWTTEGEAAGTPSTHDAAADGPETAQTTPPALPDQYRPLFKPSLTSDSSGHVVPRGAPQTPRKPLKKHTIHDGDTLESLAVRYLGDARRASELLEANRDVLTDPQLLPIGVAITIPPAAAADGRADVTAEEEAPQLVPLPTDAFRRGHPVDHLPAHQRST